MPASGLKGRECSPDLGVKSAAVADNHTPKTPTKTSKSVNTIVTSSTTTQEIPASDGPCTAAHQAPINTGNHPLIERDFKGNEIINSNDFFAYTTSFFTQDKRADINGDGHIDGSDYEVFVDSFLHQG